MSKFTSGKWIYYSPSEQDIKDGVNECNIFSVEGKIGHFIGTISTEGDACLVSVAPEMYRLLSEFVKIDEQKARAATEKNDPAYMMALMEQDEAVSMAKCLLARIDGENPDDEEQL